MNILKNRLSCKLCFVLTLLLGLGLFTNQATAQDNLKPNIAPIEEGAEIDADAATSSDEFTAKGATGWSEGATVSNFLFNDINNKKFKLYDLLDKPLIIEFWELDNALAPKNKTYLKKFYEQYNVNILSICSEDYPNEIRKLAREQDILWSAIYDDYRRFNGKSFTDTHGLEGAGFVIITPDKKIRMIVENTANIGKVGVYLQQYFAKK